MFFEIWGGGGGGERDLVRGVVNDIAALTTEAGKITDAKRSSRVVLNAEQEPVFSVSFKKDDRTKVDGLSKFVVVDGVEKVVDSDELMPREKAFLSLSTLTFFSFSDPGPPELYPLSLRGALRICDLSGLGR